ncbi:MAG: hypothetical protein CK526_05295 [Thaumarchaeota archaeon]|nr:MAG: hypothetical protein CK526_05295 [Nitrososphaerota archaeon]
MRFNKESKPYNNSTLRYQLMGDSLTTYDELNEDIQFTEDETKSLLKLSEKEILILILSEMKKQTEIMSKK